MCCAGGGDRGAVTRIRDGTGTPSSLARTFELLAGRGASGSDGRSSAVLSSEDARMATSSWSRSSQKPESHVGSGGLACASGASTTNIRTKSRTRVVRRGRMGLLYAAHLLMSSVFGATLQALQPCLDIPAEDPRDERVGDEVRRAEPALKVVPEGDVRAAGAVILEQPGTRELSEQPRPRDHLHGHHVRRVERDVFDRHREAILGPHPHLDADRGRGSAALELHVGEEGIPPQPRIVVLAKREELVSGGGD